MMTYQEALRYLESFINYEKIDGYDYNASLKLDRMRRFASLLGDPQKYTPSIHIAGSKGKGSTAVYIYSILKTAGYKTGLYTSPHLVDFRERIRINGGLISEESLSRILGDVREVVEGPMRDKRPSFFEVYTALAYLYFKEKKADFAVYETGLGGRLDATNIIEPLACAITPLSYEHTDKLGHTLKEIAAEKCGIIKNGCAVVSAPQEEEALRVIEDTCRERSSRLILVGRDIRFEEVLSEEGAQVFNIFGPAWKYKNLRSAIIGSHQMVNAAVAIGVIEAIKSGGIKAGPEAVRKGIEEARWEGRLEVVSQNPKVLLDGAQNRASAKTLADAIKKIFKYRRLILVFGASRDKDIKGMLEELLPLADSLILTKSKVAGRALEPSAIEGILPTPGAQHPVLTPGVGEALEAAKASAEKDDLILVTGSLFVVGEARQSLRAAASLFCCRKPKQNSGGEAILKTHTGCATPGARGGPDE